MTVTVMVIIHRFCDCKIFKNTFNKKNFYGLQSFPGEPPCTSLPSDPCKDAMALFLIL